MPQMQVQGQVGAQSLGDGAISAFRQGRTGEQVISELQGRYYEMASRNGLFMAHAIVTAPVIYTTAAGTGGPLVWNPPTAKTNVSILAVGLGVTVVSTVAAALGITGNTGQTSAPTATTAIDSSGNLFIGGAKSTANVYRVGTPTNAGNIFLPFAHLHTGALTVDTTGVQWVDLGGMVVVPPGAWASVAASATATTTVASISMVYTETPV